MGWRPASNFLQRAMNQKDKVIQNLTNAEDDRHIAKDTMPELETSWLCPRKGLADSDYGRQNTLVSISCYADDPRAVCAGLRRALFLAKTIYDIIGLEGLNLTRAPPRKWSAGIWGTWQGIQISGAMGLMWLSPDKAIRTAAYLREMANGTALVEHMPVFLGFLNHVVEALNKFTYQLTELWAWYDASKEGAHDALMHWCPRPRSSTLSTPYAAWSSTSRARRCCEPSRASKIPTAR